MGGSELWVAVEGRHDAARGQTRKPWKEVQYRLVPFWNNVFSGIEFAGLTAVASVNTTLIFSFLSGSLFYFLLFSLQLSIYIFDPFSRSFLTSQLM